MRGKADRSGVKSGRRKRSRFGNIIHRLKKNKGAIIGLIIVCLLILTVIISLFIDYEAMTKMNVKDRLVKPSLQYPFGTDDMGRNLFVRVIYGARYSLGIGVGAMVFATLFGVILGSLAGYFGGITESIIMRFSDVMSSIPGLLLGMVMITVLGQSVTNLIIAVGIQSVPVFIRMTRASIITVRNNEFVEAARAMGLSNLRTIFTHVLPNGFSPIIVAISTSLGMAITVAASLSFMGFGVPVPMPEWGALVASGRALSGRAPYVMTIPGLFIMITVLAFNLLGDGLRDALDPKLKR